jgi:hypothetical protein
MPTRRAPLIAVLGVSFVVGLIVVLASVVGPGDLTTGRGPGHHNLHLPPAATQTATQQAVTPEPGGAGSQQGDRSHGIGRWVILALAVVGVALLVVVVGRAVRTWGDPPRPEAEATGPVGEPRRDLGEELARTAVAQRAALLQGDPRNAIVACWLAFEDAADAAGVARADWETSAEFAVRLLGTVSADREAVARLARLYREARFSAHPVSETQRQDAVAALDAIATSLRAVRS